MTNQQCIENSDRFFLTRFSRENTHQVDCLNVSYPVDVDKFKKLVALGKELHEFHLLESSKVNEFITEYHGNGHYIVGKQVHKDGSVYINEIQYFSNVP